MRSDQRLDPQPWMTAPDTAAVLKALTKGGKEARFVGGCVRDALLGRKITDIDLATPEPPERVMKLLAEARITVVPTGLKHGTITAVVNKHPFEITTLRRDVETFGRHARVEYTDDWEADAARRDFTMNALFCAPDGTLYDAFGGIADLHARRVRFVGEAEARIREDVLRLLRYFRFYAHYGAPPPDQAALAACRSLAHLLPTLSGERVCQETMKLLRAADPAPVFALMRDQGVLEHFLPEATRIDRLAALVTIEGAVPAALLERADAVRRLGALVGDSVEAARAVASRLKFSNADRERLVANPRDSDAGDRSRPERPGAPPPHSSPGHRALHRSCAAEVVEPPGGRRHARPPRHRKLDRSHPLRPRMASAGVSAQGPRPGGSRRSHWPRRGRTDGTVASLVD